MAIPQLDLDDRTFDQLAAEGRALIPRYFPAWSDYNPSDPGITLIELFEYLTEAAIYQINRVPERTLERFAGLVGVQHQTAEPIAQTLSRALTAIRQRYRAVTENDFEALALQAGAGAVVRSKAVVQDSAAEAGVFPADQAVKVVIVASDPLLTSARLQDLCGQVFTFLGPRRLVSTKINVVPPEHTAISIAVTVARDPVSGPEPLTLAANFGERIREFLDDRRGGFDGTGWPFGRPVYRSDLYRLIEGLPGVDHVVELLLDDDASRSEIRLVSPLSLIQFVQPSVVVL